MRTLAILLVLLMASVVQAQVLVVRTSEQRCTPTGCREFTGTGACSYIGNIGDRSVYLTAAHVVKNATRFHIGYGGQWWAGRVVYHQHANGLDFAIVETQMIPARKCFTVSESVPLSGTNAMAYGYSNGIYKLRVVKTKIRYRNNLRTLVQRLAQGDSGGPVIVKGKFVGVINSIDVPSVRNGVTYFTGAEEIRLALIRIYGRMPACGGSVLVVESPQKPDPPVPKTNQEFVTLQGEVSKLREQMDRLSKTEIPVQLIGPDGKVISEIKYPLGSPIKLKKKF